VKRYYNERRGESMRRPCSVLKWITATWILSFAVLMLPSLGLGESLEDGMIMRENASIFLKDGSCIECNRFWWLVSAADFVQCDKGGRAFEVKLEKIDFEKTFGPSLAQEYAAMKEDLAASHEKNRQGRKNDTVTTRIPAEKTENEKGKEQETKQETALSVEKKPRVEKSDNHMVEKPWAIEPGESVGWIKLGMPYEKIIGSLGKTVMESDLPPHGKHQRYGIQGLEFYYKNDHIRAIRIGKSEEKTYSRNKYKISGLGLGSDIKEVVKVLGKPDYITISKYTTSHSYVYKSGILFTKRKRKDEVRTITVFPRDQYSLWAKD
jgi:hypothetical protein